MMLVQPEKGAAHEEAAHFIPAVIENIAVPVRVVALAHVGVLVEMGTVEIARAVFIGRKMGRDPIQNDPDIILVEAVDEMHEILGIAVPARGGEVTGGLIAPGTIKRMLHHRQKLHVGKSHLLNIGCQFRGHFLVA